MISWRPHQCDRLLGLLAQREANIATHPRVGKDFFSSAALPGYRSKKSRNPRHLPMAYWQLGASICLPNEQHVAGVTTLAGVSPSARLSTAGTEGCTERQPSSSERSFTTRIAYGC